MNARFLFSLASPLIIAIVLQGIPSASAKERNPWREVKGPKAGLPLVIGDYTAGCLQGARALPLKSKTYQVMNTQRKRYYAHPSLIEILERIAGELHSQDGGKMLIGDLSQARGGPTLSSHQSHQTGLDADIWFDRKTKTNRRQKFSAFDYVDWKGRRLKPGSWTETKSNLIERLSQEQAIERILVNPIIKQELCRRNPTAPWLAKVRPWWGHGDHLHLRLACPADSPDCKAQAQVPAENGCDEKSLLWWFTDEANAEFAKLKEKMEHPTMPIMPNGCAEVLN